MKLRSNYEPGTTRWAVRRAQWRALGLSEEDMAKPKVAVVNTSSALSICFAHLDTVADQVSDGIRAAGGLPFEVRTTAPSDFITGGARGGRYVLPSRDLVVNDVEVSVEGAQLDGMVLLSSCDKTAPAHLMAAARLDIPSILVLCGYQACGRFQGEKVDIEDVFESVGEVMTGLLSLSELQGMTDTAIRSPGVCAGMGTANSMHIVSEALGMALPGSTPIAATSPRLADIARASGARIVGMIAEDLRPRSILTCAAFENAVITALAVSGSVNVLRHLQAVAAEAELVYDVYDAYERLGAKVPLLCTIKPNGSHRIEDFDAAGGTRAVMERLRGLLHPEALTVTGQRRGDLLADTLPTPATDIIRDLDSPAGEGPALLVLRGNIAPKGAIMKLGSEIEATRRFEGRARIFESQETAMEALSLGRIKQGDAVVLRGLGPRGGPGVASASWFVAALQGSGIGAGVAVLTDGQLSGLNHGFVVGQICPEAAAGGLLAILRDDDPIEVDLANRAVNLLLPAAEIDRRLTALPSFKPSERRGWLAIYQNLVVPLEQGAVLRPPERQE
jgi:dihydroxy-acid dehydratase